LAVKGRAVDLEENVALDKENPEIISRVMSSDLDSAFISWTKEALARETLMTMFTVSPPAGWMEVTAQQQRRAPLYPASAGYPGYRGPTSSLGRMQADSSPVFSRNSSSPGLGSCTKTFAPHAVDPRRREYVFEVQFPRPCCVGQLELQFLPSKVTLENAAMMEVVAFRNVPRSTRATAAGRVPRIPEPSGALVPS
jgi:hypothetical protein